MRLAIGALLVALSVVTPAHAQSGQAEPGSRFMKFRAPVAQTPASAAGASSTPGAGPASGTVAAAMARVRMWASGRGPTGPVAATAPKSGGDWCSAGVCPLLDRLEQQLDRDDGKAAYDDLPKLRARIRADVSDACDRDAGLAAVNQLECEASVRPGWPGAAQYCVVRGDDPAGTAAPALGAPRGCDAVQRAPNAAGTLRWAACRADAVPAGAPAPRIVFALEPQGCMGSASVYAPIELSGEGVVISRAETVVDGYSQPGATPGNLVQALEPAHLPLILGPEPGTNRENSKAVVEVVASGVVIAGLEISAREATVGLAIDRPCQRNLECEPGGHDVWVRGNLFSGRGQTHVAVTGPDPLPRAPRPGDDIDGVVIGVRAAHPDPADLNVFRARTGTAVLVARGSGNGSPREPPHVRGTEVRGNWIRGAHEGATMGVFVDDGDADVIECNRFDALHVAIAVTRARGTRIVRNTVDGATHAVKVAVGASGVTIGGGDAAKKDALAAICPGPRRGNRVVTTQEAVSIDGPVDDVRILDNTILASRIAGVTTRVSPRGESATAVRIEDNAIEESQTAIRLEGGEVAVLGNRIRAARGVAIEATGPEAARLAPERAPRFTIGAQARPNVLEGAGAGGVLLIDAEPVNQSRIEHDNRFVDVAGPWVLARWRGLVGVVRAGDAAQGLAGAQVTIDGEPWLGAPIVGVVGPHGWSGEAEIDVADPLTWPSLPVWAVVPQNAEAPLASTAAAKRAARAPLASQRLVFSPQRVRIEAAGFRRTLALPWDGHTALAPSEGVREEHTCVGGGGPSCDGGLRVLRKFVVSAPSAAASP